MRSRIADVVVKRIDYQGKPVEYVQKVSGTYNVNTGSVSPASNVEHLIKAYKTEASYSEKMSPNIVGKLSAVFLIAGKPLTFVPKTGDKIDDGSVYEVQLIETIESQGSVALWRLVCTRS